MQTLNMFLYKTITNDLLLMTLIIIWHFLPLVFLHDVFQVSAKVTKYGDSTTFNFNVDFNAEPNILCAWSFGDGTTTLTQKNILKNEDILHHYYQVGSYQTVTSCLTSQGVLDRITTVVVQKLIDYVDCLIVDENLSDRNLFLGTENVFLKFQTKSIQSQKFYCEVDGIYLKDPISNITSLSNEDIIEGFLKIQSSLLQSMLAGEHIVSFVVYNNIRGLKCDKQFILVAPLTNMALRMYDSFVEVGKEFVVAVSADGGYPADVRWKVIENGNVILTRNSTKVGSTSLELDSQLLALDFPGTYTVVVTYTNILMQLSQDANITIQYPIKNVIMMTNSPLHYPAEDNIVLTIMFGHLLPSRPFYNVSFGEVYNIKNIAIEENEQEFNISQQLAPCLYSVTLDIYNEISVLRTLENIAVLQDISNIIIVSYKEGSHVPATILPIEYQVNFELDVTGTVQWVEWNFNGQVINTTTTHNTRKFKQVGYNNISVTVGNTFSTDKSSLQINLLHGITDVLLVNNGPVLWTENITFIFFVKHFGSGSKFNVNTGDGSVLSLDEPVKQQDVQKYLPTGLNLPFDPEMYYTSILHYEYSLDGRYTANATAWNLVNSRTSSSIAYVQLRPCQLPDIHIRDGSEVTSDLFKYKRYQNILFIPVIKLDCQGSIQTILDWKVFKISGTFSIPDETNEYHLPSNIKTSLKEFYIPSFTLDYGYYIFQLTVTMVMRDGSIGVSNVDHSKLEVVETSLVAWIIGGSLIRTGWYNNITIDGSESHDPDSAVAKFVYNWFCRTENETFPDDFNELMNTKTISKGGCLRNGMHIKSSYESKLFIPAQTLEGNNTFVFRLVITEPGRDPISTQQTIYISPGRPPSLHIRCIMNCETFLNPSERLILSGKCGDCTEFTRPSYLWYLIPKSTSNRKQELVWGHDTTTSQVNAYLSLHANVFNAENSEIYTLRLTIRSWSGSSSYSEFMFSINARPRGGTCSVNPTEGIVLSTLFAIQCLEFYDDDIPLHYVVHAETGAEVVAGVSSLKDHSEDGNLIYYGVDPVFTPTLLPIGRDENNFIVKINIKVLDAYGAYTDTFLDVKVMPPQVVEGKDIEDVALEMTTAEDSKLDQLLTDGDTQSAVQLITTVGSILNAEAEKSHSESGSITKKKVKKEEKKQKRTEAREAIIESIQNVEIRDMESLKQTSAAITQVTQEREEISDKAQRYAAEVYVNLGKYLNEQSSIGVGGEAVEGTARYILSGISNIMSTTAPPPQTKNKISMESEDKKDYASQNRNVTLVSMKSLEQVKSAILVNKVPGEKPTRLETDIMSVVLQKQEKWDIDGLVCEDVDSGIAFRLPDNIHSEITVSDDNYDEVIDIKMNNFKSNPFIWDESSTSVTSQVTSLELNKPDGKAIILENLPETIDMFIANPQPVPVVSLPGIYLDNTTASLTYGFNLTSNEGSLVLLVNPNNITSTMTLYMRYQYPSNGSQYDLAMDLPLHVNNVTVNWNATTNLTGNIFTLVINTDNLLGIGSYFITVDSQNATDDNYTISAFMANCLYWNTEVEQWNTDGCQVGVLTTENVLHCQCSHLTFFGGSFFVLPNTIHFVEDAKLFKGFLDNPVVISAVIVVFCLQVLCSIWARRKDKTDQLQAHLIVLHDNDPLHCHRYHVTIFTGMRSGAGTSAIVTLTLSGLLGKTKPHVMTSKTRKVLQQGSSDSFLLTTKESLGDLLSVRVWHDNSGSHPEWYLSRILIHEVDSEKCWYFLCKSWLAVDIGDCVIDQTFLAATKDELNLFHNQFLIKSMKEFRDGHLWFSVITRPASSSFTRLQRIACCFSVLFTSMLTSIMFYGVPDDPDTQDLDFGKFQISWREIIIGIECSILVFPINFFTVTLFRNARCNKDEVVLLEIEGLIDDDSDIPLYFLESNDNSEYSAFSSSDTAESNRKQSICKCKSTMTLERKPEAVGIESNKKHGCLPWWIIYFAWFILFSCEGVSAYVIMLYGLKYGKQRSLDWLMSILIAFFQNIFVIQPTEMIFIAALLSLLFKMKEKEDVGVQLFKNFHIVKSEHHQTVDCKYNMDHYRPPPIQAVEIARKKRQADFKLHSILREFVGQLILVWLVMEIVYTQQDPNSFYFNKIIQDTFTDTLDEVSSFVDLFEWLRETAGPAWFDQTSEFLSNTSSVLVGTVRLRQLRVLPESCSEPRVINSTLIPECTSPLTKHNLDKRSYTKPWSTTGHHIPGQGIWSFQHKHKAKGSYFVGKLHVYDRGGHIAELRGNISAANNILGTLQKSKWFEKHTRAVFIEWTLYNADVNLFCVCTLLFEVPGTGALIASSEFLVMRLYRFTSKLQMFVLVLEISYIFVLVFMMYKEVSRFYQRGLKYFNTWSILTLCNITSSLIAVVLYNIRLALANIALEQINKTTNIFISFNDVAIHHQVFGYVISIVVVGTTLKLLKMLRFNNSIFLMSNTISKISANAFSCFCTISIAMMAFATYSYLIFGPIIYDFSTLVSCLENIAVIMVGGSEVMEEVYYYFPLIGSLFFALITLTFAYVLLNAFVAMMLDAFTEIKHGFIPCPDKDIISMLVNRFYSLLGIRRPQIRLQENGDLLKVNNE